MYDRILPLAAKNALKHGGKASAKAVMGMVFSAIPEAREKPEEVKVLVEKVVEEVNRLPPEELQRLAEGAGEGKRRERKDGSLPPLIGAEEGEVVLRFAPGPSGPLHLGHSRAAILNDEYARKYRGKFILRIEDTNPRRIEPDAYQMIPEDLEWLGVEVHETHIQSDRMEIYYDVARRLIESGAAYVCTCPVEVWRNLKARGEACPHREEAPEDQMDRWEGMLEGRYGENEATLVVKTDLKHPNPAVRDFPAFRIVEHPHPKTGDRYRVYPLYNFSVAVDDHLMGCTHVLRGKDHLNNTLKQEYVYRHMGWKTPHFIHYGLVSIPDAVLKTSTIKEEIERGVYSGWDDVRLGTLRAFMKRGITAEAIRRFWLQVGVKPVDITMSLKTLYSLNREIIDESSNRYFFVESPRELFLYHDQPLKSSSPLHPNHPERGRREYLLKPSPLPGGLGSIVFVPEKILSGLKQGDQFRLKDLVNVEFLGGRGGVFSGKARGGDARGMRGKIYQWCPPESLPFQLLMPDGEVKKGVVEPLLMKEEGSTVQFERVGFAKLEKAGDKLIGYYAHP